MHTYYVEITALQPVACWVDIEAESEGEAREKARDLLTTPAGWDLKFAPSGKVFDYEVLGPF